jgi:DNA-binding transcriptional ArsR family regulator
MIAPSVAAVAKVMADGRERTIQDLARATRLSDWSVRSALTLLAKHGLVTSAEIGRVNVYRAARPLPANGGM